MGWQYLEFLESFSSIRDSFSLPEKTFYPGDDHNVRYVKDKETFGGKPAWSYVSDDFRLIIPYQNNFFEPWIALERENEIVFHCILTDEAIYRKLKEDEDNPLMSIYNIYGTHAFFAREKGDEGLYSFMKPEDIFGFCKTWMDVLSLEPEESGLPADLYEVGFLYLPEALLFHFNVEIDSIRRVLNLMKSDNS
ncbi:MAG: hypothetical protein U9O53_01195 [archaeon]|nr:hypothetical protein [archaeon]